MRRFVSNLLSFLRRPRFEADLSEELQDHMRARIEHLIASGVPPGQAAQQARQEFGSVELLKDECRDSTGFSWFDSLGRNLRVSTRMLRKNAAFTSAIILILALCIGANTALFSIVDAALFRDLPYPEPHRLGVINRHVRSPQAEQDVSSQNGRTWEFLKANAKSVDLALTSSGTQGVNLALSDTQAVYVTQHRVSAGYFRVLGIVPNVGREFTADEDRDGGPPIAILSEPLWRTSFHSDPAIVGRTIRLRGEPYSVVGVMPAGFTALPDADIWTPVHPSTKGEGAGGNYTMVARTRPGFEISQVNAELNNLGVAYLAASPQKLPPGVSVRVELAPSQRVQSSRIRKPLTLLWIAGGLVLLIGCVNIAGLILARNASRQREIATRMALGGSRAAVAMQLLTESLLLACAGGMAGVLLAFASIEAYGLTLAKAIGFGQLPQLDLRAGLAAVAVTLATTILFGLYPALSLSGLNVRGALTAGRTASARGSISRQVLVGAEVALAVVLLAGAGLVLKTLSYLTNMEPGFDASNVMTASLSLQDARYATAEQVNHLFDASLDALRQNPSVESAGVALTLPYEKALNDSTTIKDGPRASKDPVVANVVYVTPGLFETLRMKPIAGRLFDQRDRSGAPPVIIVNEAFAKRYFHGDNPLGLHLGAGEIVGIVGDTQQKAGWGQDTGPFGPVPTYYLAAAQFSTGYFKLVHGWFSPKWAVRMRDSQGDPTRVLQQAIASVDPLLPFSTFQPMEQIKYSSMSLQRTESLLLGSLALLALLLVVAGVYGLIAQTVSDQSREFGIRVALGCPPYRVIARTTQRGILLALAGCVAGTGLALMGGKYVASLLWGVQPNDMLVLVSVPCVLLLVSFFASLIPSLRLASVELLKTLRSE